MANVIVTGGSGFIGRSLIIELLNNNYHVVGVVRNISKLDAHILNDKNFTYIEKDLNLLCEDDFQRGEYDSFFHLAWGGVSSSDKNNLKLQMDNISMSIHALEICNKIYCKNFISAGTVAEYVFSKDILNVEEKQTPNDFYGAAKTSAHYFLNVRARQLKQNFIWAVIPSTFGEFRNDNNIITYTIKTLLENKKPQYGSLTQMWDFLYVSEVARALRLISEYGKDNMIYGIGSGVFKPLIEYIEKIRDLINPKLELGINELVEMTNKTKSSCVNITNLKNDTGFIPEVDFENGIERTIEFWRKKLTIDHE